MIKPPSFSLNRSSDIYSYDMLGGFTGLRAPLIDLTETDISFLEPTERPIKKEQAKQDPLINESRALGAGGSREEKTDGRSVLVAGRKDASEDGTVTAHNSSGGKTVRYRRVIPSGLSKKKKTVFRDTSLEENESVASQTPVNRPADGQDIAQTSQEPRRTRDRPGVWNELDRNVGLKNEQTQKMKAPPAKVKPSETKGSGKRRGRPPKIVHEWTLGDEEDPAMENEGCGAEWRSGDIRKLKR